MTADEIFQCAKDWAKKYDKKFYDVLIKTEDYAKSILSIGRGGNKPRKDIAYMSEVNAYIGYFYDELFVPDYNMPENITSKNIDVGDITNIAEEYIDIYDPNDGQTEWFDKIKELAEKYNFAPEMKLYKKNPQDYKGNVGDVSMILRVAICGRQNTPDMYEVFKIMGKDMIIKRIKMFGENR
jgi:glutamyl-tRNA synthetase